MNRVVLVVATLLLQAVVGDDLFWVPNSNWENPANWKLGRVPGGGELANFAGAPENSLIYLNDDVTVQSIRLPTNGRIVLGQAVTIRFSEDVDVRNPPIVVDGDGEANPFIGAEATSWECPENWITEDMFLATHPPCGEDRAIFDEGAAYSVVSASENITVRSLTVRGMELQSLSDLTDPTMEFRLNIIIEPDCGTDPTLCKCPSQDSCTGTTGPGITEPVNQKNKGDEDVTGMAIGIVVALIVVISIVVVLVIVGVFLYRKRRRGSYTKDDLLEPGGDDVIFQSAQIKDSVSFDNPLYDAQTGEVQIGYEFKEPLEPKDSSPPPPSPVVGEEDLSPIVAMDKYEKL